METITQGGLAAYLTHPDFDPRRVRAVLVRGDEWRGVVEHTFTIDEYGAAWVEGDDADFGARCRLEAIDSVRLWEPELTAKMAERRDPETLEYYASLTAVASALTK